MKTLHGANAALVGGLGNGATQAHDLALCSVAPTFTTDGTELSGGAYARITITWTYTPGQAANSAELLSPIATVDWLPIVAICLYDGAGNLHYFEDLPEPIIVAAGQRIRIPAGALIVKER